MSHWKWLLVVPVGALLLFSLAQAQDAGGGGRRGGGNRDRSAPGADQGRRRGNFDPAQMRERMLTSVKEDLGATDDEWRVLQPKVDKVMTAQRETRGSFSGGFMGGRGGPGGDRGEAPAAASDQPQNKVAQAESDLRKTLDNKSAASEEITRKLTALREVREKARTQLQAAQKELKEVLTPRQEATLVVKSRLLD